MKRIKPVGFVAAVAVLSTTLAGRPTVAQEAPAVDAVPEVRPPVIPSLALLRDPDATLDLDDLHNIDAAAFSPDGKIVWLLGTFYPDWLSLSEDDRPVPLDRIKHWQFEPELRVVGFDPHALAVTRILPGMDPAFRWTPDEDAFAIDDDGRLWLPGTRWTKPPRDEAGRLTDRAEMRPFVARFDPDGVGVPELWLEDDAGFEEARRTTERLATPPIRIESQRDERGHPLWVDHWVNAETGQLEARFVDHTPGGPRGIYLLRDRFFHNPRFFLLTYSDDRFGRDRYFSRYDRETGGWSWPRRIGVSQGPDITVLSPDGQTVVSTTGGGNHRAQRVEVYFLRPDEAYNPELARRIADAFAPVHSRFDPEDPHQPDPIRGLEPERRITLPAPPDELDPRPQADRELRFTFGEPRPDGHVNVWALALTPDGDTAYVGYSHRKREAAPDEKDPRPRWVDISRLLAVDVGAGTKRWEVDTPKADHIGRALGAAGSLRLAVLPDGGPLLFVTVATQDATPGDSWNSTLAGRAPRIDVHRLHRDTGDTRWSRQGEPNLILRPLPRLGPPDADLLVWAMDLRFTNRWWHGVVLSRELWRLERWDGPALKPTVLIEHEQPRFRHGAWQTWMPRFHHLWFTPDATALDVWTARTGRGPDYRQPAAWHYRNEMRLQRFLLAGSAVDADNADEAAPARPVASPYAFTPLVRWSPRGPFNPQRALFESYENERLRVLRHAGPAPTDWTCTLEIDRNDWQDGGISTVPLRDPSAFAWFTHRNGSSGTWLMRLDLRDGKIVGPRFVGPWSSFRNHGLATNADATRVVAIQLPDADPVRQLHAENADAPEADAGPRLLVFDLPPGAQ